MRRGGLRIAGLALAAFILSGCAPPAVVFLSPHYDARRIRRVALAGFQDFPGTQGSGQVASSIFEKYLLVGGYGLVDRTQAQNYLDQASVPAGGSLDLATLRDLGDKLGVDAIAIGQLTDYTDSSDRTVVEDIPLEQTSPIYGRQEVEQRSGDTKIRLETDVVTGYSTTMTDTPVQSTETVYAHAALSVRLVDVSTGEMLWSGSSSAVAEHLQQALEDASNNIMQAVAKRLKAP